MRRLFLSTLLALGLVLGPAGGAQAALVLDQPLVWIDGRFSHLVGGDDGFVTHDRIQLDAHYRIDRVSWTGAFLDLGDPSNNPVLPSGLSWTLQVSADAAGNPGVVTDSVTLAFDMVERVALGSATLAGQPVFVYTFTALLADPLHVGGGVPQWFSVFAESDDGWPRFGWLSGSGGDGVSRQFLANGDPVGTYTDRALRLEGVMQVPVPATWLLVLPALAGAGVLRRTRAAV
ncbi:hypothetical protein [Pseudorhodoferax sp.]|uniref:hypothetical protein n=1 Tax=Pseudorhodoferax sp. TaxID=1993553 RepID=UPI002DD66A72|nr:hypothetical protein [Pseudorhodoferax sp.]